MATPPQQVTRPLVHTYMDLHDGLDKAPQQELDLSTRREHVLLRKDHDFLARTNETSLYLEAMDEQAAALRAEAAELRQLRPDERAIRIDQRTAEIGAAFCMGSLRHRLGMETALGTPPAERAMGLQVIENRVAILEGRVPSLIVPFRGLDVTAAFDVTYGAMLFNSKTALSALKGHALVAIVFHEQTHRMQWDAMTNPKAYPQFHDRLIGSWTDNARLGHYAAGGELASERFAYENQPMERFAFARESQLMRRLYDHIEERTRTGHP